MNKICYVCRKKYEEVELIPYLSIYLCNDCFNKKYEESIKKRGKK